MKWMFLYQGCSGARDQAFAYVNVSSNLFGKRATAFRLSYINGSYVCGIQRNNTLWGYATSIFLSPLILPSLTTHFSLFTYYRCNSLYSGEVILMGLNEFTKPVNQSLTIFPGMSKLYSTERKREGRRRIRVSSLKLILSCRWKRPTSADAEQ